MLVNRAPDGSLKSVCRLSVGRLVAVETLNSAAEQMLARRMLAQALTPPRKVMASGDASRLKAVCQGMTTATA